MRHSRHLRLFIAIAAILLFLFAGVDDCPCEGETPPEPTRVSPLPSPPFEPPTPTATQPASPLPTLVSPLTAPAADAPATIEANAKAYHACFVAMRWWRLPLASCDVYR